MRSRGAAPRNLRGGASLGKKTKQTTEAFKVGQNLRKVSTGREVTSSSPGVTLLPGRTRWRQTRLVGCGGADPAPSEAGAEIQKTGISQSSKLFRQRPKSNPKLERQLGLTCVTDVNT